MSGAALTLAERIADRLATLEPVTLEIDDDSAEHAGHAGAAEGSHFSVLLVSPRFAGLSRVARHRLVYEALGPLMRQGVHALALRTYAPDEL